MSLLWLLFISLTVIGGVGYNVAMKYGSANANVFGFAVIISLAVLTFQTAVALVARYAFNVDVTHGIDPQTVKLAILAGLGAALIDLNYFLAVRHGSVMASQPFLDDRQHHRDGNFRGAVFWRKRHGDQGSRDCPGHCLSPAHNPVLKGVVWNG